MQGYNMPYLNSKKNEEFGSVVGEILTKEWSEKWPKMVNVIGGLLKLRNVQRSNTRFKAIENAVPGNHGSSQTDRIPLS